MATTSTEILRNGAVALLEYRDETFARAPWLVVTDDKPSFWVRFTTASGPGRLTIGFDCAVDGSDHCLHGMVDHTSSLEGWGPPPCAIGEVTMSDEGVLTVLARPKAAHDVRTGWVARLPQEVVVAIRRAIAITEERAAPSEQR